MSDDLPYRAEYAKSRRASCKGCKSPIAKEALRLAVMVQVELNTLFFRCWFPPLYFKAIKTNADLMLIPCISRLRIIANTVH